MSDLPTKPTLGWVTIRNGQRILAEWEFGGTWLRQNGTTQCGWWDEDVTDFTPAIAIPAVEFWEWVTTGKPPESVSFPVADAGDLA